MAQNVISKLDTAAIAASDNRSDDQAPNGSENEAGLIRDAI